MIYIVTGQYHIYRDLCKKLGINHIKDARHVNESRRLIGIRIGREDRLIFTCGYQDVTDWNELFLYIDVPNKREEYISCCGRLDDTLRYR